MNEMTVETLTAPQMVERLNVGTLTIMVPDFNDPCGIRKYPRTVFDVFPDGVLWNISFTDTRYPMILSTTATHPYEVTTDAPGESAPCEGCQAVERDKARAAAEEAERAQVEQSELRAHRDAAREQGRQDGDYAAGELDINGTPCTEEPRVPAHFADVAAYYESGFSDGVEQYDNGE